MRAMSMLSTSPRKPTSGAAGSSAGLVIGRARMKRPSCPSRPDRASAVLVDERRQFLVELAQCHLDDIERGRVGDAMAAITLALLAHLASSARRYPSRRRARRWASFRRGAAAPRRARIPPSAPGSAIAWPPKRTTMRLAVERAQVGERFREDRAFVRGRHAGRSGSCFMQLQGRPRRRTEGNARGMEAAFGCIIDTCPGSSQHEVYIRVHRHGAFHRRSRVGANHVPVPRSRQDHL